MNYRLTRKKLLRMKYSCLLTIPRIWILTHRLDNGGYVDIELADNGSLVIKPAGDANVQH